MLQELEIDKKSRENTEKNLSKISRKAAQMLLGRV